MSLDTSVSRQKNESLNVVQRDQSIGRVSGNWSIGRVSYADTAKFEVSVLRRSGEL
jgi:hypothetical protein